MVRQLPPPRKKDGPDLKSVLEAVLAAVTAAAEGQELDEDAVMDAVSELEVVAEAARRTEEPGMLEKANKAVRSFGRIAAGVTALTAKATELRDAVAGWFGG